MRLISIFLTSAGIFGFVLSWVLNPQMSILNQFTSFYANGRYGWLTILSFLVTGFGIIIGSGTVQITLREITSISLFEFLLIIYGILIMGLGVFSADPGFKIVTTVGLIHKILAGIVFVLFLINLSVLFFMNYKNLNRYTIEIILGLISLSGMILLGIGDKNYIGIYQRMMIFPQFVMIVELLARDRLMGMGI